ncbi:tetraacyldisaccharide 4'-kinase [Spirosoma terrae]
MPFSRIYGSITDFRNWLYDRNLYSVFYPEVSLIAVGNLTVGGTGKTPMIEYLIKRYITTRPVGPVDIATLSRGYGRKTKGFRLATEQDNAETIGDEPFQLYRKFNPWVTVCVGERRAEAIRQLQQRQPQTNCVLLDDAFQHRAVQPHLNILLTDYSRLFYKDHPFPAGRLRERRHGAERADAIVVTKCPDHLPETEQAIIKEAIGTYARPGVPIYFAGLRYGTPMSFATQQPISNVTSVVLASGLANADPLEDYVRTAFRLIKHHRFSDHHTYTRAEFDKLIDSLKSGECLVVTEKDWVKLDALLTDQERATLPVYYLPVEIEFLDSYKQDFDRLVDNILLKNP